MKQEDKAFSVYTYSATYQHFLLPKLWHQPCKPQPPPKSKKTHRMYRSRLLPLPRRPNSRKQQATRQKTFGNGSPGKRNGKTPRVRKSQNQHNSMLYAKSASASAPTSKTTQPTSPSANLSSGWYTEDLEQASPKYCFYAKNYSPKYADGRWESIIK